MNVLLPLILLGALPPPADEQASAALELEPSVSYAQTWDAAVAEGRRLNLPLLVHVHGFF